MKLIAFESYHVVCRNPNCRFNGVNGDCPMENDKDGLLIRMSVFSTRNQLTWWDAERLVRNRIGREDIRQAGLIAFSLSLRTEIDGDTLYVSLYRRLASSQEVWHLH